MRKSALPGQHIRYVKHPKKKNKKCCKHPKSSFSIANIRCVKYPKNQKVLQTCENQLYQGEHPICQTSEKPKSAANIRKPALPWRTSDVSNIRKTKKCCIHAKTSFTRATHPMCQISEKPKSAANLRKPALPGQTSDMSNIRKTKKCCKPAKTSFTRANIQYVKHLKNQKVLQTSENQLYHGEHPICQISEKPKSAANIRKAVLPWRTSDMPNIQKTKKCCKHPKSSFSRANIRYVRHPKNQKVLHTCENQLYQGNTSDMSNIQKKNKKCCKHPKSSFSIANIRCVKYPKNQKVLQTCENQLYQGEHPICQTSEKPKSAANIRKPALPWRTSDVSNIRKTKKCCIHAKTSFTRATHLMCQISEKPKSAANLRKPALPGQTSDMSNIRKTKKCCKPAKTSFTRANIQYVKHLKNQKVLQTSENQLYHGEHPICQISEKPKSAANIRKSVLPWRTSDMPNIRKTKKCCKHPKTSFTMGNIRYVRHPKNQKVLHTCENQLYQGNTSDVSNIRKTKKCCKPAKTSFARANI